MFVDVIKRSTEYWASRNALEPDMTAATKQTITEQLDALFDQVGGNTSAPAAGAHALEPPSAPACRGC